jgi:DNA-nicking Smr family endonuclease
MTRRHTTKEEHALFRKTVAAGALVVAKPARSPAKAGVVGAKLDLHGMTEAAAHRALLSFCEIAVGRGVRRVLVVTGRSGVLKTQVPRWLAEAKFTRLVAKTAPAERRHGGDGALYIELRKQR